VKSEKPGNCILTYSVSCLVHAILGLTFSLEGFASSRLATAR